MLLAKTASTRESMDSKKNAGSNSLRESFDRKKNTQGNQTIPANLGESQKIMTNIYSIKPKELNLTPSNSIHMNQIHRKTEVRAATKPDDRSKTTNASSSTELTNYLEEPIVGRDSKRLIANMNHTFGDHNELDQYVQPEDRRMDTIKFSATLQLMDEVEKMYAKMRLARYKEVLDQMFGYGQRMKKCFTTVCMFLSCFQFKRSTLGENQPSLNIIQNMLYNLV